MGKKNPLSTLSDLHQKTLENVTSDWGDEEKYKENKCIDFQTKKYAFNIVMLNKNKLFIASTLRSTNTLSWALQRFCDIVSDDIKWLVLTAMHSQGVLIAE